MKLQSTAAKVLIGVAILLAVLTLGMLAQSIVSTMESYIPQSQKLAMVAETIVRWFIDPVFLAASALTIEFLERIWRELRARPVSAQS